MDKKKVIEMLNQGIELEHAAYMQFSYQALSLTGVENLPLREMLEEEAGNELGHARKLAERVVALGGVPSQKIPPFKIGKTAKEMIRLNIEREKKAIDLYRKLLRLTHMQAGYELIYYLALQILGDEMEDLEEFEALL
jgi:bacterioferritin